LKLELAEISRVRGIPVAWPALVIGERGLIVYGPNGVGKSSIIDALEATIKGRSSLFPHARAGVNWDSAAPHVRGGGPPSCKVHGRQNGKPQILTLGEAPAAGLAAWVDAASKASFVLRRYMLLEFVDAEPKERYDQIEPFLNLAGFSDLEHGLRRIVNDIETRDANVTVQVLTLSQTIRQIFGLRRETAVQRVALVAILKERLAGTEIPFTEADFAELARLGDKLATDLGGEASSNRIASLGALKHQAQQLASASVLRTLYDQTLAAADKLIAEMATAARKIPLELLTVARDHIQSSDGEICPVCEQGVDRAALLLRLSYRIKENEAVGIATNALESNLAALKKAALRAREAYSSFAAGWSQLGVGAIPNCYAESTSLFESLETLTAATVVSDRDIIVAAFARSECDPSEQIKVIDEAIAAVGGGVRRAKVSEAANYVTALQSSVPALEQAEREAARIFKQKMLATSVHAYAEAARKEAVQKVADRVADLANTFYGLMHPREGIATAKLTVRPATTGSMLLNSTFYDQEAPPLKYYSESHLDTLGLCFFLAIRKLEVINYPDFKLLLVDDVLHSVDAEHRARLAELLKVHFADHQIVLVTHDKNFYDRLRATLGSGYNYIVMSNWDIDSGPRLSDPSTDLDRITNLKAREGKSHDEIAAAGGRFFEWALKGLTERLQVAIPARFTFDQDIGSMWPSLAAKLRKHKAFEGAHPGLVEKLNQNAWVRNKLGAHDSSEAASPVTEPEVTEFADGVAALYRSTTCEGCRTVIQVSKDDRDVWRCGCSKLQYSP
jgi:hypothetical protein